MSSSRSVSTSNQTVLHVLRPAAGGMCTHIEGLFQHWNHGRWPTVLAGPAAPAWHSKLERIGVKIRELEVCDRLEPSADLRAVRRLRRLLQVERPAVVHCHGSKAALVGRVAAWGLPVCTVYTVHGELSRSHSGAVAWAKRGIERVLAGMTDRFVAVSPTVARELRTRFNVPVGKLTVLPNAVDAGQFELSQQEQDEAREWLCGKLSLGRCAHIVGSAARLAPEKGLDTAVRALAALPKVRSFTAREPVLVVAGEGPERQKLQQLAQALGVAERVHLLGHVEDVPRFLGALDAFVLPSRSEGQSIALLEAMAASLPIAASRVGGIPDVLTHEVDGLLVPPEDPEALACAVMELQAKGAALGVRARRTVEHMYSWPKAVAGLEAIYQELVEQLTR